MKLLFKSITAIALGLTAGIALAEPDYLTTHNNTNEESNAYIAGYIPSPYATPGNTTRQLYWTMVRMACWGHTTNGKCSALIKIGTDTANPKDLGTVTMDMDTGDITPKLINSQGYTIIINGPGEATINKD